MGKKKKNKNENFRVKQFFIYDDNPMFNFLVTQLHFSKNLYNATLYEIRQSFFKDENKVLSYKYLEKYMRTEKMSNRSDKPGYDYYQMATAQSAQQTIMKAIGSMEYFRKSKKKYEKNPLYYTGEPKLPKYIKKPYYIVTLTNQNCTVEYDKVKGNIVTFPTRTYGDFYVNIDDCFNNEEYNFKSLSEVRFYFRHNIIVLEVVYKVKPKKEYKLRKDRLCGVDLGVTNFAACSFNFDKNPIIIDSSYIKSVNQFYNKKISHYKSLAKTCNDLYDTPRIEKLWEARYRRIKNYMHKASTFLVKTCVENRVSKIVIGENKGWKQKNKKKQNFASIPFTMFKKMVEYKAKFYGIKVIFVPERYTSGTSFLDKEELKKKFYNKERRVHRGLFISNKGILINDDINAGYQMIKKYEEKENLRKRRLKKNLISCYNKSFNWKKIASKVERVYVI